jgi:hypothetical protein
MKILILSIYSESPLYNKMLNLQRKYIHSSPDITTYFVQFRPQTNPVEISGDFLFVNGLENRMKITEKTLSALKYLLSDLNQHYDFILRTNISTITNFSQFIPFLNSLPKTNIYCTGNLLDLQWIDHTSGINDKKLFGTLYAAGTSIILSYDVASNMVENLDKFRHDIVDDVSIGVYMRNYLPNVIDNLCKYKASYLIFDKKTKIIDVKNYVFIRNRINNDDNKRNDDLIHMVKTIEIIK